MFGIQVISPVGVYVCGVVAGNIIRRDSWVSLKYIEERIMGIVDV